MSLYIKYRPTAFEQMVGSEAGVKTLQGALDKSERPKVFLLHGASGCGKTTLARIAADYIGAKDKVFSIREINASEARGIDDARTLIEQTRFVNPVREPTVFIIDEVHRATVDWQNAMLKPLEDVPKGVYYFLCTTEPEKLLRTIKTRCISIQLESLTPERLLKLVQGVAKQEGLVLDEEVLEELAHNAGGSPRQALTLLESISTLESKDEMLEQVSIGEEAGKQTIDLCRALIGGKASWREVSAILRDLKGEDPEKVRRAVLGYATAVLLKRDNAQVANVLDCFADSTFNSGFPGLVLMAYQSVK